MRTYTSLRVERLLVLGFLSLIVTGTLALWAANRLAGQPLSLLDALFTSTSAVCVTGLSVVDTGKALSLPAQGVLLVLIQLGGLGVMTATTALPLLLGLKIDLRQRLLFAGGLGLDTPQGAVRLLLTVLGYTLAVEALMALPLFWGFLQREPAGRALYLTVFHSVSAFCNAGFSPYSDNLESFAGTFWVPGAVMALVVLGGLGFPAAAELRAYLRRRHPLSAYTRLVLVTTGGLILVGAVLLALSEWNRAFRDRPPLLKGWNALFHSITPRTAGFDTVSMQRFSGLGLGITILLMFIGASPASTGGGIKTTTFGVLLACSWTEVRGEEETVLWGRRVDGRTQRKALALSFLYLATLFMALLGLCLFEPFSFRDLLFEAFSAMGTVGLSVGITPKLSPEGKMILVFLMFWGRVGIVTFLYGILAGSRPGKVHYPPAQMPIG